MEQPNLFTVSYEETLKHGLKLVGFTDQQINNVRTAKNLSRFCTHYTTGPLVYAMLFHKLQTTDNADANVSPLFAKVG